MSDNDVFKVVCSIKRLKNAVEWVSRIEDNEFRDNFMDSIEESIEVVRRQLCVLLAEYYIEKSKEIECQDTSQQKSKSSELMSLDQH